MLKFQARNSGKAVLPVKFVIFAVNTEYAYVLIREGRQNSPDGHSSSLIVDRE